ncbi:hypothetical protein [Flavobacterium pallidum]|uniref:Uncharacterized protein n=1 Tax=Flavobacterium pallidum TaxID=2172098 RepID=A0A2S1SH79_9FLAO|nr:hypothetical protein [Flavobacterium pallidum]AWI25766.1 hypothetical protein HYN49_07555 [Flavobacterium pallidum]
MRQNYKLLSWLFLFSAVLAVTFISCSKEDDEYIEPIPEPVVSPVSVDLTKVPYDSLSKYHFFDGEGEVIAALKDLTPSLDVLPYAPSSSLFSDYAHKKRFVWMPKNTKATFNSDGTVLELPVGAVLIKNFYYDNVQNIANVGGRRIIETRLMIRKSDGWIFADYKWNAEQTEATFDLLGSFVDVEWKDENNVTKSSHYRIPNESQCVICHKSRDINDVTTYIPIGIKPQNLNNNYNYGTETKNQLTKWIEKGYLDSNFTFPTAENTTIDYSDTSQPIELRARSYVDINCAHCHGVDRHCDYRPMRFAFSETKNNLANMGVCVDTQDMQSFPPSLNKIVNGGRPEKSMLYYRINTTDETYRMPLHGRTILHDEGIALMRDWINSLERCD